MNWKRVDEHIELTGYLAEDLDAKLKRTQEELGRLGKLARTRTIKASALWCASGVALGMTGMIYWYEQKPKPQPVVVEIERSGSVEKADLEAQIKTLNAKIDANYTQQIQRQKEVRFHADKLELAKQVHDTKLVTAQEGADHIRQMARELGITSAVLK